MGRAASFLLILSVAIISQASPGNGATYTVDGITLGERLAQNSPTYRSYKCQPHPEYDEYTWCDRTQLKSTSFGSGTLTTSLMHSKDGIVVYVMTTLSPVAINRSAAQAELDALSTELHEQPVLANWSNVAGMTSVVATWGKIELKKLSPNDVDARELGLVDLIGNIKRSSDQDLPVYRIAGASGYFYRATFDASGRGHRYYVAADMSQPAIAKWTPKLEEAISKDQARGPSDYELWSEVAEATRNLSLATSPTIANQHLDKIFEKFPVKKLRSHVWSLLPLGVTASLSQNVYWAEVIYGPNTRYPDIRRNIQTFLAANPSEPFREFLYYTNGEFDKGIQANPNSILLPVFQYASGHVVMRSLLEDIRRVIAKDIRASDREPVNETLIALNEKPELYGGNPLGTLVTSFSAKAATAQPFFDAVMRNKSSKHADDAAYMLGWLAYHQNKSSDALKYFSYAISLDDGDYVAPASLRQVIRIISKLPARDQIAIVEADSNFSKQPALWYVATRSAFRDFQYSLVIEAGERALSKLKFPIEQLPATTDPKLIEPALKKLKLPDLDIDMVNLSEIPYLIQASRELSQHEKYLATVETGKSDDVDKTIRSVITKYSRLLDEPEKAKPRVNNPPPAHRDLRQALHLIDISLGKLPQQFAATREWLHYRKIRVLAASAPAEVAGAIAKMESEYPQSRLMDDALAEQLYAQGVGLKDVASAQGTFQKLITKFPKGNAVDNAYTWMAITYRCAGRTQEAHKANLDIIRLFPATRHALYAAKRELNLSAKACTIWKREP